MANVHYRDVHRNRQLLVKVQGVCKWNLQGDVGKVLFHGTRITQRPSIVTIPLSVQAYLTKIWTAMCQTPCMVEWENKDWTS